MMVAGVSTRMDGSSSDRMRGSAAISWRLRSRRGGRVTRADRRRRRAGDQRAGAGAHAQDAASRPDSARLECHLHGPHAQARRARGVVGHQEVLAQREALVVGRHVDAAQVAVALEDEAEHVVRLSLGPLGAVPQEGDRRQPRIVARQAVADDPQPVGRERRPQVIDDLEHHARVHAGKVGEQLEAELGVVVERGHHGCQLPRPDDDLGRVVARRDGGQQLRAEPVREASLRGRCPWQGSFRVPSWRQTPAGTVGPTRRVAHWPRRSRISCWSFIMP